MTSAPMPDGVPVTEAMIDAQVRAFYRRVREDARLGPIFARTVTDWEPHFAHMVDFWSAVLLGSRRFKGNPVAKHAALDLRPDDFQRWLALFEETAEEVCPPEAAALFQAKARMIGASLQLAAQVERGELPRRRRPVEGSTAGG